MNPREFYDFLIQKRPDLIPTGFENMAVSEDTINLICKQIGFREILGVELIHETLDELCTYIKKTTAKEN